jgi:spermidine/putrescine ABC transporter ATP-binding subunit
MTNNVVLTDVTKRFGDVLAVEDIDLAVEEGTFVTLLGPSGCGKTTTLRMIAGFESPSEGQIEIAGETMNDRPPYKRPTGMVFQNYALFPHKTVGENVGFGLKMDGVNKEERRSRVAETLELVELEGYEDRRIDELSGGQQQRVALARAIITEPTVLLLDEPLGALDLKLRKNMQIELKNIQQQLGITFIYVTHDQEEALTMSDQVAVMNDGHLEQLGSPSEIYEKPASRFVADFIGDTNLLEGTYRRTDGQAILETDEISIEAPDVDIEDGTEAALSIRPERIDLEEPEETDVGIEGRVVDVIYHGNNAKVHVDIGSRTIVAELQNRKDKTLPDPDSSCTLSWDRDRAQVVQ